MVVVAIIGVMSSLAIGSFLQLIRRGRVNGAASGVARMMASARVRAIGMACRTSVQINGPDYVPATPVTGAPTAPGMISVFRKDTCDALAAPNGFFENVTTPDHIIASYPVGERTVEINVPVSVLPSGKLGNDAVVVSWGLSGGVLTRTVYVDQGGSGTFTLVPAVAGADISFGMDGGTLITVVALPATGPAYTP